MRVLVTALAMSLGVMQALSAQTVVELYTSQGCSSCPPADRLLGELADRDDVIALSLHVDYWDYLGWKDSFASPAFSDRQRGYARTAARTMIYTPQMVIGGLDHIVGSKGMELSDRLKDHESKTKRVALDLERDGSVLSISAQALSDVPNGLTVQLVQFSRSETVSIKRGENAGSDITYHNVVRSWQRLGEWSARAPLALDQEINADLPAVVIIQDGVWGPILAAARLD